MIASTKGKHLPIIWQFLRAWISADRVKVLQDQYCIAGPPDLAAKGLQKVICMNVLRCAMYKCKVYGVDGSVV